MANIKIKKIITDIHKLTFKSTELVAKKAYEDLTEEDVDMLGEAVELLNDLYETLYDEVFITGEVE